MKEIIMPDLVKFEKKGDFIEGKFLSIEKAKKHEGSFSLVVTDKDNKKLKAFVNNIAYEKLIEGDVKAGQEIKIVFDGKQKTADGENEYYLFKVFM